MFYIQQLTYYIFRGPFQTTDGYSENFKNIQWKISVTESIIGKGEDYGSAMSLLDLQLHQKRTTPLANSTELRLILQSGHSAKRLEASYEHAKH